MIPYKSYRYIYPPRAEYAVDSETLLDYDNGEYLAQPKLNGDCMVVFTNGVESRVLNRHKKPFKKQIANPERFAKLHRETLGPGLDRNKWMVLVGEYMDKGKKNDWDENFNDNFIIFDILVYDSVQLLGQTFEYREELLGKLFGRDDKSLSAKGVRCHKFLYTTPVEGVYRVKTFRDCLGKLWEDLVKIDMYEGLVLKKASAKLENGVSENNNSAGQLKIRKPTKNYLY